MTDSTGIAGVDVLTVWCVALASIGGVVAGVWRALRPLRQLAHRAEQFWDDWEGTEERPGVPARPGVMQRLESLEAGQGEIRHELFPNSGESLRDAVNRIEGAVAPPGPDTRLAPA